MEVRMNYITSEDRIYNIGISKSIAGSIKDVVSKWNRSCGPSWTVQRIKDIKLFFINHLSGGTYVPSTWMKVKEDGIPSGPFGALIRKYGSKPIKVFNALAIYTSFVSNEVTREQKKKFYTSVKREKSPSVHIEHLKDCAESVSIEPIDLVPFKITDYNYNEKKFSPNYKGKSVPSTIDVIFDDFKNHILWDFLDDDDLEPIISDSLGKYIPYLRKIEEDDSPDNIMSSCVGKISAIQEPGFKARFIANPCLIYQIVLHPLGKALFDILRNLPWDCTHNQQAGVLWTSEQIQKGSVCYSVDLSDATNNFPFEIQKKVLQWLNINDSYPYIKLFELVSKGNWYVPALLRDDNYHPDPIINWTNGQPLGLYPSFASFALTHGLILRSFEVKHGLSDTFRVLGDDVVIANQEIYEDYMNLLRFLQVPVSSAKSIISNKIAEFAGSVIGNNFSITTTKWRNPIDERRLSLISSLPIKLDLTNEEEFISSIVRSTPIGNNVNSEGLSLKSRIPFYYSFWKKEEENKDIERLSLSSEVKLYYESRFCQDFSTLPLMKRKDIDDFLSSILNSPNYRMTSEIYQDPNRFLSQESISKLWYYLIETFRFPSVDVPKELVSILLKNKHSFSFLIKSLNDVYRDNIKNKPIQYFKRQFIKSAIKWESLSHENKQDLIKIITLKFIELKED